MLYDQAVFSLDYYNYQQFFCMIHKTVQRIFVSSAVLATSDRFKLSFPCINHVTKYAIIAAMLFMLQK